LELRFNEPLNLLVLKLVKLDSCCVFLNRLLSQPKLHLFKLFAGLVSPEVPLQNQGGLLFLLLKHVVNIRGLELRNEIKFPAHGFDPALDLESLF
jgi:hypothetical protein